MRISCSLVIATALLLPLQALAQSGSVGGSGGGSAGVTSGTAGTNAGTTGTGSGTIGSPGGAGPPRGTNSLGTAQSSGRGVTTGAASGSRLNDKRIEEENRQIDRKLKSICRGC